MLETVSSGCHRRRNPRIDAHPGARQPVLVICDAGFHTDLFELLTASLTHRKFAMVSLAANRSIKPSWLISVATTPHTFPGLAAMPVLALTSAK